MLSKKAQIFSTDVVVAVVVFLVILISSSWFWDMTKEKISLTETRNDLELVTHNAVSVLINTVGDPPNWHKITFNNTNVYSLGVGKNRPWIFDEQKLKRLDQLNDTEYETIKRMLGIRGATYEFYLNVSKFSSGNSSFTEIATVGRFPNATASQVVRVNRFALSDVDKSWISFTMLVWNNCGGAEC